MDGARTRSSTRSGQALVIGVTIMFILLAVGLLFLRNALDHLRSSTSSNEAVADRNFARGGIDFVDHQLMTSPLGADWRPQPRNLSPAPLGPDPQVAVLDPDFQYLRPWAETETGTVSVNYKGQAITKSAAGPSGGFTRLDLGNGRALIRVTYNPRNARTFNPGSGAPADIRLPLSADNNTTAPGLHTRGPWSEYGPTSLSQYIRIDSIGRYGDTSAIDNNSQPYSDPTLSVNAGNDRPFRVQMVAYKALGQLGDHLLFVSNKSKEGGVFDIGSDPPSATPTYFYQTPGLVPGDLGYGPGGAQELAGGMVVNGNARYNNVGVTTTALPGAGVFTAGNLLGGLLVNGVASGTTASNPTGSLYPGDVVRDNNWFSNSAASPLRSFKRLITTDLDLARFRTQSQTALPQNGALSGFYIQNFNDLQPQITMGNYIPSLTHSPEGVDVGPRSWFSPYNPPESEQVGKYWTNPGYIYSPPALHMIFYHPGALWSTDPDTLHTKHYFIRLRQGTGDWPFNKDWPYVDIYYTPDALADAGVTTAAANTAANNPTILTDAATGETFAEPVALISNHTIMAEGNLSIHGDLAPAMTSDWWSNGLTEGAELLIVSRGTIYLDGSLRRAEQGTGTPQDITLYPGATGGNTNLGTLLAPSVVALMAQDHVALNLTQTGARVQPWDITKSPQRQADTDLPADNGDRPSQPGTLPPAQHWTFGPNTAGGDIPHRFRITFSLAGVPANTAVRLFLRHAAEDVNDPVSPAQNTWVDGFLNPPNSVPSQEPYRADAGWSPALITKNQAQPLNSLASLTPWMQIEQGWEYAGYSLDKHQNGQANRLNYGGDNAIDVEVLGSSYYLSRVSVEFFNTKANAWEEASLNVNGGIVASEGSFYVIPKDWFYFNPPDNSAAFAQAQRQRDDVMPQGIAVNPFSGQLYSSPVDWSQSTPTYDATYPGYVPSNGAGSPPVANPPPAPVLQSFSQSGSLTVNKMPSLEDQAYWSIHDPAPLLDPQGNLLNGRGGPVYSYDDGLVDLAFRRGGWLSLLPEVVPAPGLVFQEETRTL